MDESMDLKDLRFSLDPVKLNRHRISVLEIRPFDHPRKSRKTIWMVL